jgi:hypothetical protein
MACLPERCSFKWLEETRSYNSKWPMLPRTWTTSQKSATGPSVVWRRLQCLSRSRADIPCRVQETQQCQLMRVTVTQVCHTAPVFIAVPHYSTHCPLSSPLTASHCLSLSLVASHCLSLSLVASHRLSLPLTASRCLSLPLTNSRCLSLPLTISRCLSLPLTASHCLSLGMWPTRIISRNCSLRNAVILQLRSRVMSKLR